MVKRDALSERAGRRYTTPRIVAYYWDRDGGAPEQHLLREISSTGVYVYAREMWCVGTIITLTLQREAVKVENGSAAPCLVTQGIVVRHTPDGAGIQFMLREEGERRALKQFMRSAGLNGSPGRNGFVAAGGTRGQALVELAMVVPLLFFLMVLAVNFGGWVYSWIEIGNAVRTAAEYASLGVSSAGDPATATGTTLVNLINADLAKLPNTSSSNPAVYICENDGTNTIAITGTCPTGANAPVADPEEPTYVAVTVDITYTYTPFFLTFSIPRLGIGLPTIPSTIHRRAVMRILN